MVEPAARRRRWQSDLARAGLYGAILAALAGPASAATLQVVVAGVRNGKGDVMVAVCSERRFLKEYCEYNGKVKAAPGEVTVTLEVPPGTYAVQAYHDEDRSSDVTLNVLGLPVEGIGFSNDAPFRFSAPSYRDAAFQLGQMGGRIRLTLRYLF
jgi:uncharacterized protein (DUF2141 family)